MLQCSRICFESTRTRGGRLLAKYDVSANVVPSLKILVRSIRPIVFRPAHIFRNAAGAEYTMLVRASSRVRSCVVLQRTFFAAQSVASCSRNSLALCMSEGTSRKCAQGSGVFFRIFDERILTPLSSAQSSIVGQHGSWKETRNNLPPLRRHSRQSC